MTRGVIIDENDPRGPGHLKYQNTWESWSRVKTLRKINMYGSELTPTRMKYLDPDFYEQRQKDPNIPFHNIIEVKLKSLIPGITIVYERNCGCIINQ